MMSLRINVCSVLLPIIIFLKFLDVYAFRFYVLIINIKWTSDPLLVSFSGTTLNIMDIDVWTSKLIKYIWRVMFGLTNFDFHSMDNQYSGHLLNPHIIPLGPVHLSVPLLWAFFSCPLSYHFFLKY